MSGRTFTTRLGRSAAVFRRSKKLMMFSQGLHLSARLWLAKGSSADLSGQEHYSLFPQKQTPVKAAVGYFGEQSRLCRIP